MTTVERTADELKKAVIDQVLSRICDLELCFLNGVGPVKVTDDSQVKIHNLFTTALQAVAVGLKVLPVRDDKPVALAQVKARDVLVLLAQGLRLCHTRFIHCDYAWGEFYDLTDSAYFTLYALAESAKAEIARLSGLLSASGGTVRKVYNDQQLRNHIAYHAHDQLKAAVADFAAEGVEVGLLPHREDEDPRI